MSVAQAVPHEHRVLVVCNVRGAGERLRRCLRRLEDVGGADVRGEIGDADPEQAVADTLATFPADEIVIATEPPVRAHWLARDLVERTADRFSLRVTPIVVDEPRPPVPLGAAGHARRQPGAAATAASAG